MSPQLTPLAPLALAALLAACGGHTQAERVPAVPGGDPRLGRAALAEWGCGGCHVIPGVTAAVGRVGPPLTDFAERAFVAGRLPNEPASLVRWILDPQGVSPGTAMPDRVHGAFVSDDEGKYTRFLAKSERNSLSPF